MWKKIPLTHSRNKLFDIKTRNLHKRINSVKKIETSGNTDIWFIENYLIKKRFISLMFKKAIKTEVKGLIKCTIFHGLHKVTVNKTSSFNHSFEKNHPSSSSSHWRCPHSLKRRSHTQKHSLTILITPKP